MKKTFEHILHLFAIALISNCATGAEEGNWTVKWVSGQKNRPVISVSNRQLDVAFMPLHAWNISSIDYDGRKIGSPTGATGCVIHWDGKAVGTGHGDENVSAVALHVDDMTIPLVTDGKTVYEKDRTYSGKRISLRRESAIGPFDVKVRFDFSEGENSYITRIEFTAREQVTAKRFEGYRYVFMHMMPEQMSCYAVFKADASIDGEHSGKASGKRMFDNLPFKALACYAPDWQTGIAYIYPEAYPGGNHMIARAGKDNKFRAILFPKEEYATGENFSFTLKVTPFHAQAEDWQDVAKKIVAKPFQALRKGDVR